MLVRRTERHIQYRHRLHRDMPGCGSQHAGSQTSPIPASHGRCRRPIQASTAMRSSRSRPERSRPVSTSSRTSQPKPSRTPSAQPSATTKESPASPPIRGRGSPQPMPRTRRLELLHACQLRPRGKQLACFPHKDTLQGTPTVCVPITTHRSIRRQPRSFTMANSSALFTLMLPVSAVTAIGLDS